MKTISVSAVLLLIGVCLIMILAALLVGVAPSGL